MGVPPLLYHDAAGGAPSTLGAGARVGLYRGLAGASVPGAYVDTSTPRLPPSAPCAEGDLGLGVW